MAGSQTRRFLGAAALALLALAVPALEAAEPAAPRSTPVGAGDTAPDFTLTDQNGTAHTLSAERGKRIVVLAFYRGRW